MVALVITMVNVPPLVVAFLPHLVQQQKSLAALVTMGPELVTIIHLTAITAAPVLVSVAVALLIVSPEILVTTTPDVSQAAVATVPVP